jgi:predicted MFS family arabinose efflux permease
VLSHPRRRWRLRRLTDSDATLVRDRLTWLAYAQLAVFGYFFYGFGPVVPLLLEEQHTSRGVAGLHATTFAAGLVVAATAMPYLVRRFGRQAVAWAAMGGLGAVALGFWAAHPLWATLTLAGFSSVFGALIVNTALATLSDHHGPAGPAALSEGNALGAAVGLGAPLVLGAAVATGLGWRPGLAVTAGLVALAVAGALAFRVRIPPALPVPDGMPAGRLPRSFWLVWCCLICTSSVEVCLNLWVADVLMTHSHTAAGAATAAVSVIIGGMVVGRLLGVRLLLRWSAPQVLLGALAVSVAGFAAFWLAPVPWLALAGLAVLGLGNGTHFPLGMALAVGHSGGQPDLAMSRATYGLSLAFGAAPFALGVVADRVGPHAAILIVPAFLVAAGGIVWRLSASQVGVLHATPAEAVACADPVA